MWMGVGMSPRVFRHHLEQLIHLALVFLQELPHSLDLPRKHVGILGEGLGNVEVQVTGAEVGVGVVRWRGRWWRAGLGLHVVLLQLLQHVEGVYVVVQAKVHATNLSGVDPVFLVCRLFLVIGNVLLTGFQRVFLFLEQFRVYVHVFGGQGFFGLQSLPTGLLDKPIPLPGQSSACLLGWIDRQVSPVVTLWDVNEGDVFPHECLSRLFGVAYLKILVPFQGGGLENPTAPLFLYCGRSQFLLDRFSNEDPSTLLGL